MTYSNIIFDFDGTLTDSRRDIASTQLWVLQQIGVTGFREEDLYRYIGKPLRETFRALLPPSMHGRLDEAAELYAAEYPARSLKTTTLFPGVYETLAELSRRGVSMAVASTKRGKGLMRVAGHFDIGRFFVQLQGSDNVPFKPDPFIINKIIDEQGWERGATLMVGDSDNDILAGRRAGIATCGVTYGACTEEQLRSFKADYIIHQFSHILALLDGGVERLVHHAA